MRGHMTRMIRRHWQAAGLCLLLAGILLVAVAPNRSAEAEPPPPWDDVSLGLGLGEAVEMRLDIPEGMRQEPIRVSLLAQSWTTITSMDFEAGFPGAWQLFGDPTWEDTGYRAHGGSRSGYCVGGGSGSVPPPGPYPNNATSWMVYGPFDLSGATDCELLFDLWLKSQGDHDYLYAMASTDGVNFSGSGWSGNSAGWQSMDFDLTDVHTLGNLCGQSNVWAGFVFTSDASGQDEGAYLDNIVLRAFSGTAPTTYITRQDNENNAHTGSPDGDMFPANGDCIYNNNFKSNCPDLSNPLAPIEFNIVVPTLPSFSTAELSIYANDVDEQGDPQDPSRPVERDEVYLNGHFVGTLTGANAAWSTSHWFIDPSWVRQGNNLVEVRIDLNNGCWCTSVDWGQLVLGGGGGTASIRSWGPMRDCWYPGSTQAVLVEVDTSLASQGVRVEINVLDAQNVNLIGTSQTKTIYGTQDDAFLFNLNVPFGAMTGQYKLQVIVYDTQSGLQQDYDEKTIRIDPACETVTPVITPTATRTATPTPTPTHGPPCSVSGQKTATPNQVAPGDEVTVSITIHGHDDCPVVSKNADVMLVIDRSGSMDGAPLQDAKNAAKTFVGMLDLVKDQVGLVSYSSSATTDHLLSRNASSVRQAIDQLSAGGNTNITDGINKAQAELESMRRDPGNAPVMLLMTDGEHNTGPGPGPAATAAKAKGTRIIVIGLGNVDEGQLRPLASSPGDYYYAATSADLQAIYQQIAGSITKQPATNMTLVDQLSSNVTLVPGSFTGTPLPTVDNNNTRLTWQIPLLKRGETKTFTYRVRISPTAQGYVCINDYTRATYTDSNGQPATLDIPPACVTVIPPSPTPTPSPTLGIPYWKPGGWIDYARSGMPDFDQRQYDWRNPRSSNWSYCGPLALANCLWWFDSKMEPFPVTPPTINDNYPLVQSYSPGQWDDHDPRNLRPFVEDLAWRMDTDGQRTGGTFEGTYVSDMYSAILGYLSERGLAGSYDVTMVEKPSFDWVASEVERCEDVILLLGFWTREQAGWERVGGHFVTMAGVDRIRGLVAFSNPIKDSAESGWSGRVLNGTLTAHAPVPGHDHGMHNDAGNISHDVYYAVNTDSPGGTWGPADYTDSPSAIANFFGQNFTRGFPERYRPKGDVHSYALTDVQTEVEYAIAISPAQATPTPTLTPTPTRGPPCTVDGLKKANPDQVKAGGEVTVILTIHGHDDCPVIAKHVDVMLVIDRSGSMGGAPLQDAKNAAKTFVDGLDLIQDQVGLVSYSDAATTDHLLSRSAGSVRQAIDQLSEGGYTNITDAINKAQAELESMRRDPGNAPVILLMTDGKHNVGVGPGPAADAAKAKGTRIIAIGLGSVDEAQLRSLASSPSDYYYAATSADLKAIYEQIAGAIIGAPATNITLVDQLSNNVTLVPGSFTGSPLPTVTNNGRLLTWYIPLLKRGQTKTFTYRVKMSQTAQGRVCINDFTRATYTDSNGHPATLDYPPACVTVKDLLHDSYCKDHFGDDGSVPSNPNGEAWWQSPDIWVRHRPDGIPVHQNPQGSVTNYVYATVRNRGNVTLSNIEVGLYFAEAAAAIPWSAWTRIGTATIPSLDPWRTASVYVDWLPPSGGHYCFLARIHSAEDPVRYEGLVPFDNNLCQKNVQVLDPKTTWSDNEVIVRNPLGDPTHTDLVIRSPSYPPTGTITVRIPPPVFDRWQDSGGDVQGAEVVQGTTSLRLNISPDGQVNSVIGRIPFSSQEQATFTLDLGAPPDTNTSVDVRQQIEGEDVGGSTYRPPFPFATFLPIVLKS